MDDPARALDRACADTRASYANRAHVYRHLHDVLSEEFGEERAAAVMAAAFRRRGEEIAEAYRGAADARDLAEVGRIFVETSACDGALFRPGIESLDADAVVLRMEACPLADAWRSAGLLPDEVDRLCEIASAVDFGTSEGAGLALEFLDRQARPGSTRCLLRVSLPR